MNHGILTTGDTTVGSLGRLTVDPSLVTVNGDFSLLNDGLLTFDIAGTSPDLFSQLDISGVGLFQGTIEFDFIDGFAPTAGDSFDLINAAGQTLASPVSRWKSWNPDFCSRNRSPMAAGHYWRKMTV